MPSTIHQTVKEDAAIVCGIAAQRAGVTFCGISKWPKIGRIAIFQHDITTSSFALPLDQIESHSIMPRVQTLAFLLAFAWHGMLSQENYEHCPRTGAYVRKSVVQ